MIINFIKSVLFNLHFYILLLFSNNYVASISSTFWFVKLLQRYGKYLVLGMKVWLV